MGERLRETLSLLVVIAILQRSTKMFFRCKTLLLLRGSVSFRSVPTGLFGLEALQKLGCFAESELVVSSKLYHSAFLDVWAIRFLCVGFVLCCAVCGGGASGSGTSRLAGGRGEGDKPWAFFSTSLPGHLHYEFLATFVRGYGGLLGMSKQEGFSETRRRWRASHRRGLPSRPIPFWWRLLIRYRFR